METRELVVLTTRQAAKLLQMSEYTLREHCKAGRIPHVRIGERTLRFDKHALEVWFMKQSNRNWKG